VSAGALYTYMHPVSHLRVLHARWKGHGAQTQHWQQLSSFTSSVVIDCSVVSRRVLPLMTSIKNTFYSFWEIVCAAKPGNSSRRGDKKTFVLLETNHYASRLLLLCFGRVYLAVLCTRQSYQGTYTRQSTPRHFINLLSRLYFFDKSMPS